MFSGRVASWTKIFALLTGAIEAMAMSAIPDERTAVSASPRVIYRPERQYSVQAQRELIAANMQLVNANR